MATTKKPAKKKSVSAKKLCSKIIKREGVSANGQLKPGYKWRKGGGVAIKVVAKKTTKKSTSKKGLSGALCTRTNPNGSTTTYSAVNGGKCSYGGTIKQAASLNGAKKKPAKKKPVAKKKPTAKK